MNLDLSGRVALVTGGSKGIGRATAVTLARDGADVAICARGEGDLAATAEEVRSATGRRCLAVSADLSTLDGCQRFVRGAAEHFGRADILVCCANMHGAGGATFTAIPDEQWLYHFNVKFFSSVRCAREAIPHMQRDRWGRIILVSGMATRLVRLFATDNGPVCAALTNLAKQLAAQVVGDGIRVNVLHPDLTRTPLLTALLSREARQRNVPVEQIEREHAARAPLGRLLEPEEIANVVAYLCSAAADAITGQSIAVDGGAAPSVHY